MKSYSTVMYHGYGVNQFWVGETDASGRISGFFSLTLDPDNAIFTRDDMLYYVAIDEQDEGLEVQCIQQYMAWAKKLPQRHPVTYLIEHGIINIVDAANTILAKHEQMCRRSN